MFTEEKATLKGSHTVLGSVLGKPVPVAIKPSPLPLVMRKEKREGDPKGWSAVLITALGSGLGEKQVPRGIS
jgi:hypothetical protein